MTAPIRVEADLYPGVTRSTLITEPWSPGEAPYLDQPGADKLDLPLLTQKYRDDGMVVLPGWRDQDFMAELDEYAETWMSDNFHHDPQGYGVNGYMECDVLRRICCTSSLSWALERLLDEEAGVHLNLTNWRSTQRNWHQDGYLNPAHVQDYYAAVWIAVDDIHEDAGPFEFVRGSHRLWDPIRMERVLELQGEDGSDPDWPYRSEHYLTPYFEREIEQRDLKVEQFLAHKGDILVWHPRLLHRGSTPKNPELERRAIIAHYSGINHRSDMPAPVRYDGGAHVGHYFPIGATA